jgi:anthranilate phosphoribosyltransferase
MLKVIEQALECLCDRQDLDASLMRDVVSAFMRGEASEVEIAAVLTALRVKGEAIGEIVGAARAMVEHATPIVTHRTGVLDTCGTGGDQLHTFNISTTTAFVVAATGVPVAKHGNRSVSSSSGAADVLEALGVNIQLDPVSVGRCVQEIGLGFCFAALLHGAMKHVGPIRKQLKFRTIFNLLGPLTNPAKAEYQLLGTGRIEIAEKLAYALAQLDRKRACVVCGAGHLDEVSLWGTTTAFEVQNQQVQKHEWTVSDFGLPECRPEELKVTSPAQSAEVVRTILSGKSGPHRNIVLANSAVALWIAGKASNLREGVQQAAAAIDSGAAEQVLHRLVAASQAGM